MEVRPPWSEQSRELADLRRRAYGPGGDISADPAAVARLHELEDLLRDEEPVAAVPVEPAVREPIRRPEVPKAEPAPQSAHEPTAEDAASRADARAVEDRAPAPTRRSWWQRVPVWGIALASAGLGAAIALSAVNLAADRPEATLQPATSVPETPADWDDLVRGFDGDPSTMQYFGDFHEIDVWELRSRIGAPCVLLSSRGRPFTMSCAAQDLDPIVDFTVQSGMLGILNDQLRDGMLLRFVGRDDRVDVWVREAPAREAQSPRTSGIASAPSAP
ncbi:hypothetical protein GCM10009775_03580 [Microbacterium aoyamense]|uniref:DUF306 domain-containing protein n=1 Tax=Microbacterium aoyamense TaxID=344166 RepID=A0ABN2P7L9_9MICO|nr:hypothetical protein [Microbacterium aoyamense]